MSSQEHHDYPKEGAGERPSDYVREFVRQNFDKKEILTTNTTEYNFGVYSYVRYKGSYAVTQAEITTRVNTRSVLWQWQQALRYCMHRRLGDQVYTILPYWRDYLAMRDWPNVNCSSH
jgi:hypothetical protein